MALIVIVGAGIAGLSAALALADFGDVIVLERRGPEAANSGAGIQLSPNAMKALSALGTAERVATVATAPDALVMVSGRRIVLRLPYKPVMEARFGAPYFTVARAALHGALTAAVTARGIAIRYDAPVERITLAPDGNRLPGIDRPADLLVAADGVHSALRGALAGDGPRDTGWTAWRGIGSDAAANETDLVLGTGHHLVRYALSNAQENCVLITRDPKGPGAVRGDAATMMADVARWTPWPIKVMPRHVFHGAGVAFVGDAAHAMLPFLAQGGAMALEDAVALGASVRTHGVGTAALSAYAAARTPRTQRLAAQTARQGTLYHLPPPLAQVRDLAIRRAGIEGVMRRVDWIYGWAPPA